MSRPGKKKGGLHKNVSSVLEGVPIPQGVRNWRPPDECGPDWTGDLSDVAKSNISSVFKGVPDHADGPMSKMADRPSGAGRCVARYRGPQMQASRRSLRRWILQKLFCKRN